MFEKKIILSFLFVSLFVTSTLTIGVGMLSVPQNALSNADQGAVPAGYPSIDLDNRNTPVSILVYNEFADIITPGPINEFRNTITAIENTFGPEFHYDNLTSYTQLAAALPNYDILLLPEQENMNQSHLDAITSEWNSQITAFVNGGGIVIALDCNGVSPSDLGSGPTMKILNETGLMTVYTPYSGFGWALNLVNATDALARGVSSSWTAPDGSVRFVTSDATVVVDDGASAIVAHKIIGAGHVVLLGFDLFTTEPNSEILLANAIRLYRHVVFDHSHDNLPSVTGSYSLFANDLAENGFAVSGMDTFDAAYLQAAEVLVIPLADYHGVAEYTTSEIDVIEDFVSSGGGLFIISDAYAYGNVTDPVNERFGFVRNKTMALYDSDDFNPAGSGYSVIYHGSENIKAHSITLDVGELETWAGTGLESYPSNAVPLIVSDSDGTSFYNAFVSTNGTVFSAAATYSLGRVVFIGDSDLFADNDFDVDGTEAYFDDDAVNFARNCIGWLSAAGMEEKVVLFDESHAPNYGLNDYLIGFGTLLTENGYTLNWMSEFLPDLIATADILFILDGTMAYNSTEIVAITSFVAGGGGLYLAGAWGQYIEEAQTIGHEFGFGNGSLLELIDTDDTIGPDEYIIYDGANLGDHPIIDGISRIELYRSGTIETPSSSIIPVITTDDDGTSDYIGGTPADGLDVMAATQFNMGRVFYSCDYLFMRYGFDGDLDGVPDLYEADNSLLLLNAFHWLTVDTAPSITISFPNGGEVLNGTELITWDSSDLDADSLTFEVLYSDNSGSDWTSLVIGLTVPEYEWNTTLHDDGSEYMIRVIVSDGEFSVADDSDSTFEIDNHPGISGLPFGIDLMTLLAILGIIALVILLAYFFNRKRGGGGEPPKKSVAKKKKK
ncbi:hypothetical protein EU528_12905 [Candidatus Thorarchaeota archaeon]|nr:MAG: hypothetical protein EU528_12905 [Candidatus Thorarchaeota archaeon]